LGSRVRIRVSVKVRASLGFRDKVSFRVMVLIDCPFSALFGEGESPGGCVGYESMSDRVIVVRLCAKPRSIRPILLFKCMGQQGRQWR